MIVNAISTTRQNSIASNIKKTNINTANTVPISYQGNQPVSFTGLPAKTIGLLGGLFLLVTTMLGCGGSGGGGNSGNPTTGPDEADKAMTKWVEKLGITSYKSEYAPVNMSYYSEVDGGTTQETLNPNFKNSKFYEVKTKLPGNISVDGSDEYLPQNPNLINQRSDYSFKLDIRYEDGFAKYYKEGTDELQFALKRFPEDEPGVVRRYLPKLDEVTRMPMIDAKGKIMLDLDKPGRLTDFKLNGSLISFITENYKNMATKMHIRSILSGENFERVAKSALKTSGRVC